MIDTSVVNELIIRVDKWTYLICGAVSGLTVLVMKIISIVNKGEKKNDN